MIYTNIISEIQELTWQKYNPKQIIFLSLITAVEFSESLKIALLEYPNNQNLIEMAKGELKTNNLLYLNYNKHADHWEFLSFFCNLPNTRFYADKSWMTDKIAISRINYIHEINAMSPKEKAMTIFSREQELSGIFKKILESHDWNTLGFGFYKYYLERHIELDSQIGGHADLTKKIDELDETVLLKFYQVRLKLYKSLG